MNMNMVIISNELKKAYDFDYIKLYLKCKNKFIL